MKLAELMFEYLLPFTLIEMLIMVHVLVYGTLFGVI